MLNKKIISAILATIIFAACIKDDGTITPTPAHIVREWTNLKISAQFENPAVAGRNDSGTVTIQLYNTNTIKYNVTINNLLAGDTITAGHIHLGDAVTNGPVFIGLNPVFSGNTASGTITITQGEADSLVSQAIYVNFHSTMASSGLMRAQMDRTIDFAADVNLLGMNEVPPVTTTATGHATLRLMTDKTLFSKVSVSNLAAGDALMTAHIHTAPAGMNGSVIQFLDSTSADFNTSKVFMPSDSIINLVKAAPVYVNVHSMVHPGGFIRGQVR